ncbi:uncharacterized protein LOC142504301 [Primulina tabacum]|uniref:uncharacterized protein LOC142504301 n=1 Tax=Primulina tabacum TaxID=48773 RepID=UPI003F59ADC0
MRPPKFFGTEGGEKATAWLKSMNYLFNFVEYTPELRLKLAVYQLKDRGQLWWKATEEAIREFGQIISWEVFCTHFIQEYSPPSYYSAKEAEFNQLVHENMSVGEYGSQFYTLLAYVPHVSNSDRSKLSCFMLGLNQMIHTLVMTGAPTTYPEAVEKAKNIEGLGVAFRCQWEYLLISLHSQTIHRKQRKFKAKEKQFKKKSYHSSSSSGSSRGGRSSGYVKILVGDVEPSYQQPRGSAQQYFPGPQQARVHALTHDQAHETPEGVIADTGESHSFLSAAFIDEHEIATTLLLDTVAVSTPAGVHLMSHEIVLNCVIRFDDNLMITNLVKLSMSDFDSLLGMDTLTNYRATVNCFHGVVIFRPYYGNKWNFYEILKVSDIPVVKDFPDVFPDEIPDFQPQRKIDLSFELMSGTNSISRAPYRLALAELKELKEQL